MVDLWFSPLAPVLIYLLGAGLIFILARPHQGSYVAQSPYSSWIGLAVCLLVLVMLVSRAGVGALDQHQFARWTISGEGRLALDRYSLAYALIPTLFLIGFFWSGRSYQPVGLLTLAGLTTAVFISADRLSFTYALFIFDLFIGLYWLYRGRSKLLVFHLALSFATMQWLLFLDTERPNTLIGIGLGTLLWLRVGLWPMIALSGLDKRLAPSRMMMVWLVFNAVQGTYIAGTLFETDWPAVFTGVIALWMLLISWLAWLENQILLKYLYLIIVQANLAFLIAPTQPEAAITLALLYTLSLGVLWLTPQLGKPNVLERHWLWIYAAPIFMSVSFLGVPFTLGWVMANQVYQAWLGSMATVLLATIVLAHGLSLSVLPSYWVWLLQQSEKKGVALRATLILVVPFLVPWLGSLTYATVTGLDLLSNQNTNLNPQPTWALILLVWLIALGAGFWRSRILKYLNMVPQRLVPIIDLGWLWRSAEREIHHTNQGLMRLRAMLEGQSYFGWGLLLGFIGLVATVFHL